MLNTPASFAETTTFGPRTDVLSDVLASLRVTGSLLLAEDYAPPWGIAVPSSREIAALLGVGRDVRVVAFHLVTRGRVEVRPEGGEARVVEAGEVAVCVDGAAHRLGQGRISQVVPLPLLMAGHTNPFRPAWTPCAEDAALVCGVFFLRHTHLNPLIDALPPLLHVAAPRETPGRPLHAAAALLAREVGHPRDGSGYVVARLIEVLCADVVRAAMACGAEGEGTVGWFQGLRDPLIGRALALVHAQPGLDWSVGHLGREVGLSPSRLAARFSAVVGESPMAYVTRWRMRLACDLLADTERGVGDIAARVGYTSVAAFNRAFKRYVGAPPAARRAGARIVA